MWLNISFILIQSNLTYSSNAIALNLENQPIKTGEYCNTFSLINIDIMFFKGCFVSCVNMHLLPSDSDYISNRVNVGFNMLKVTWNSSRGEHNYN